MMSAFDALNLSDRLIVASVYVKPYGPTREAEVLFPGPSLTIGEYEVLREELISKVELQENERLGDGESLYRNAEPTDFDEIIDGQPVKEIAAYIRWSGEWSIYEEGAAATKITAIVFTDPPRKLVDQVEMKLSEAVQNPDAFYELAKRSKAPVASIEIHDLDGKKLGEIKNGWYEPEHPSDLSHHLRFVLHMVHGRDVSSETNVEVLAEQLDNLLVYGQETSEKNFFRWLDILRRVCCRIRKSSVAIYRGDAPYIHLWRVGTKRRFGSAHAGYGYLC